MLRLPFAFFVTTATNTIDCANNCPNVLNRLVGTLIYSLCNKRHELAENFLSLILINLVPKVASTCE